MRYFTKLPALAKMEKSYITAELGQICSRGFTSEVVSVSLAQVSNEHVRAELGNRVRKVRKSRRLTQADVAERAGLSRPTVSLFERGKEVSLDSFLSIFRALDLLDALDAAVVEPGISPMAELTGTSLPASAGHGVALWSWGDERDVAP